MVLCMLDTGICMIIKLENKERNKNENKTLHHHIHTCKCFCLGNDSGDKQPFQWESS